MKKFRLLQTIKNLHKRFLYIVSAVIVAISTTLPAYASPTFTDYSISSSYTNPGQATTAGGSLWYLETTTSNPYYYTHIGSMTTSGTTTDYDIRALSGNANISLRSLTTGPDGNVWFNGGSGNSVYTGILNISTGAVTLYANPIPSYQRLGAIITASDGNLWYYIESAANNKEYLVYVNPSSGVITAAYTFDTYSDLTGIASGSDGKIWITDSYYKRVYSFTTAGTPSGSYNAPSGSTSLGHLASGGDGNLWMHNGVQLLKLTTSGVFSVHVPPTGMNTGVPIAGSDGALWLTAYENGIYKIGRISSSGGVTTYTIPGSSVTGVKNLIVGPDDAIWFIYQDSGDWKMGSLTVTPDFTTHPVTSSYTNPTSMTTADGSIWYIQTDSSGNNGIGSVTTAGTTTDYAVMPSGATYMKLIDVTTGPDGNVWFSGCSSTDSYNWTVQAGYLDVSTGTATFYTNTALGLVPCNLVSGSLPGTITIGPDNNVWYVVNTVNMGISKKTYLYSINPSTGVTTTRWNGNYGTFQFRGMVTGPDGRLWATNGSPGYTNKVYAFTVTPTVTVSGTYTTGTFPSQIISGPDGNLWFTEMGVGKIAKMTTSGGLTEYSLDTGVSSQSLAAGPDGAVWFTSSSSSSSDSWVGRITTTGSITQYATTNSYNDPYAIVLGPDDAMWFTAPGDDVIGRLGY